MDAANLASRTPRVRASRNASCVYDRAAPRLMASDALRATWRTEYARRPFYAGRTLQGYEPRLLLRQHL